jgi:hypothetical protein
VTQGQYRKLRDAEAEYATTWNAIEARNAESARLGAIEADSTESWLNPGDSAASKFNRVVKLGGHRVVDPVAFRRQCEVA